MRNAFDQVDPYYEMDGLSLLAHLGSSHLSNPHIVCSTFNVSKTEEAFPLGGELPGVTDGKQFIVEWFQSKSSYQGHYQTGRNRDNERPIPKRSLK